MMPQVLDIQAVAQTELERYIAAQAEAIAPVNVRAYQVGFEDGRRSMMRGSLHGCKEYRAGYNAGLQFYKCDLPYGGAEAPLERGWGDELLNPI